MMNKYNIIELKSENYTAKINLSRGANCISLCNKKYNASLLREPDYDALDNPFLYGMPVLFPANRISDGKFTFEGRTYTFDVNEASTNCHLHGHLHEAEFELLSKGEGFANCRYRAPERDGFPHAYCFDLNYILSENGLRIISEITNLSQQNMPCILGFHTTFNLPFVNGSVSESCRVKAGISDEIERNMKNYLPTGNVPEADEVKRHFLCGTFVPVKHILSKHYKASDSGEIELSDIEKGLKIVYRNDAKYKYRLFYNGGAKDYICLEPMTSMANCVNAPFDREYAGFMYIEPHKTLTFTSEISLVRID